MGHFAGVGEDVAWQGHIVSVVRARFTAPDGEAFEREIVRHPGAVSVVPVDHMGRAVLVRQFRAAVMADVLEAPAGTRDVAGEEPATTARRELAEEAGLEAAELCLIARLRNSPGLCDQETLVYLATGLTQCPTRRTGVEERHMAVEAVPLDELDDLVATGRLVDATTVVGLYRAQAVLASRP